MHHHANGTSLKVAVSFHSKHCVQKIRLKTREKWLNLTKMGASSSYFNLGLQCIKMKTPKLLWKCNLKNNTDLFRGYFCVSLIVYMVLSHMHREIRILVTTNQVNNEFHVRKAHKRVKFNQNRNYLFLSPLHVPWGVESHLSSKEN